jgi:glyoxylase-like metal-dependent hydrolase (beta-lactamase superfamily II)
VRTVRDARSTAAAPSGGIEITGLAQREAWLARDLPPVEQLRTDLWSVPVPIPDNPLRYVSAYVFASDGGLTLIDTGWESDEGWAALTAGLDTIGGGIKDVRGVLVTHMHFDHIGLARRVRETSGAWIALHRADRDILANPNFRDVREAAASEVRWLCTLGAAPEEATELVGGSDAFSSFSRIALPDRLLADGEIADVPGWSLRAVHTPGHTPGHLCFADEVTGLFFAGDHVLPRISPNISAHRSEAGDPLGDFLRSLQAVRSLPAQEVLPAHEWRFRGLSERVDQLTLHHQHRLDELLTAVREHPGAVPWELAGHLTWSRPWDQYDGRMRIFAVTETAAHLFHLVTLGRITGSDDPVPVYSAVDR